MKTLATIAILTNLTTGVSHAYEIQDAACEEVIQRPVVLASWAEDVFKGAPWAAWCETTEERK